LGQLGQSLSKKKIGVWSDVLINIGELYLIINIKVVHSLMRYSLSLLRFKVENLFGEFGRVELFAEEKKEKLVVNRSKRTSGRRRPHLCPASLRSEAEKPNGS